MTANIDAVIDELNLKFERFIELYISSLDKVRDLEGKLKESLAENEKLKNGALELNREIENLKVANAVLTGDIDSKAKAKISKLVREIDKCIALLNN